MERREEEGETYLIEQSPSNVKKAGKENAELYIQL